MDKAQRRERRRRRFIDLINEQFEGNQARFENTTGIAASLASRYISGSKGIGEDMKERIETILGLAGWFDGVSPIKSSERPSGEASDATGELAERGMVIPLSNAWGSMGLGAPQPENEIIVSGVAVSEDWLRQSLPRISHPSKLAMITACGHSMAPTFEDGDTLIVDRGVDQIKDDGVFVAAYDDELYIKRFQRRPTDKTLLMKSDNPHYETIVIDTEKLKFEVLGKVVWVWNGKKL